MQFRQAKVTLWSNREDSADDGILASSILTITVLQNQWKCDISLSYKSDLFWNHML